MAVEIALAGNRAFSANVESCERVELPALLDADDHAELLRRARIGRGPLHSAVFQRRALVLIEIGQNIRGLCGAGREAQRRSCSHCACRLRYGAAVLRDEHARHSVMGPYSIDVLLDHGPARSAASRYRLVQFIDGGFLQTKFRFRYALRVAHLLSLRSIRLAPCSAGPVAMGQTMRLIYGRSWCATAALQCFKIPSMSRLDHLDAGERCQVALTNGFPPHIIHEHLWSVVGGHGHAKRRHATAKSL